MSAPAASSCSEAAPLESSATSGLIAPACSIANPYFGRTLHGFAFNASNSRATLDFSSLVGVPAGAVLLAILSLFITVTKHMHTHTRKCS